MNGALEQHLERRLQRLMDLGEKTFFLLLYAIFVTHLAHSLATQPYNILAVISEGLIVFFTIVRRDARMITTRPSDWLIALMGTALPLLVKAGGHPVVPLFVGTSLMAIGLFISVCSKMTLRRSFGLAAANRGLVNSGPYRLIRHPLYAGYLLMYVGFLLNNLLAWNFFLYLATTGLLLLRVMAEEALLIRDPDYGAFRQSVKYRLLPGIF